MPSFMVGGRQDFLSTQRNVMGCLWNPSTDTPLWVTKLTIANADQGSLIPCVLYRYLTRGTPGLTVTPDADNHTEGLVAPPSGAVLDLPEYTVNPTLSAVPGWELHCGSNAGVGYFIEFGEAPFKVPPGTGLGVWNRQTGGTGGGKDLDLTFAWDE